MSVLSTPRISGSLRKLPGQPCLSLWGALLTIGLLQTSCGKIDLDQWAHSTLGQKQGTRAESGASADKQPMTPKELTGHSVDEVKAMLGKPQGKLRTQKGEVWLYADWRVQLDDNDTVLKIERETAAKVLPTSSISVTAARPITVIANGGQAVNLQALMPAGKVAVVDFYADWCGPCRRISPHLEKLAQSDPDVVLVKVDIVNWGTPVTRQYGIRSVPNIRVFDRRGQTVGQPTSSFNAVQRFIAQAKGS